MSLHSPKWPVGTRVRLSPLGRSMRWARGGPDRTAVVHGGSYMANRLSILVDGQKTPARYHEDFWEPIE